MKLSLQPFLRIKMLKSCSLRCPHWFPGGDFTEINAFRVQTPAAHWDYLDFI
ncbi:hypothetical protein M8494_30965 [Serratia ureilytica]